MSIFWALVVCKHPYSYSTNRFYRVSQKNYHFTFCSISQKPLNGITNIFFSLKLRSVQKFWIQNHFWPIPGGWDISETKWVSSTQKFLIILTCNKPDSLKMTSSCPEQPLIDPDWTWKIPSVPEKPSIAPNGRMVLKSCSFQSYFKISQN